MPTFTRKISDLAPLLLVFAAVAPVYFIWSWSDQIGVFGNDGPSYLMMLRHYADRAGESAVNAEAAALSRFPPLYPLTLSWLGAATDLHWVHALTTAAFVVALVVYCGWLLAEELSAAQAALLALMVAILPESWLLGLLIQSEYLYLLWSLLCLALLALHRRRGSAEALYGAALCTAAAILTRTIGVALFVPLALAALRAPRRAAAIALMIATLPLLVWFGLHSAGLSYAAVLKMTYGHDSGRMLLAQLQRELPALRLGAEDDFIHPAGAVPAIVADALILLCLAAALWRGCRMHADGLYVMAYLAIVLVWPYPEEAARFLWVVVPVLLVQPLLSFSTLAAQAPSSAPVRRLQTALAALVFCLSLPAIADAGDRYRQGPWSPFPGARSFLSWYDGDPADASHRVHAQITIMDALRRITALVPPKDCVMATRPDLVNYFSDRRSVYTPLDSLPDPWFQRAMHATGCRYVYMNTAIDLRYPTPMHPLNRLGDQITVLDYVDLPDPPPGHGHTMSLLAQVD